MTCRASFCSLLTMENETESERAFEEDEDSFHFQKNSVFILGMYQNNDSFFMIQQHDIITQRNHTTMMLLPQSILFISLLLSLVSTAQSWGSDKPFKECKYRRGGIVYSD